MTNERIKEIALANGFKLKEQPDGEMDLNPYVYDAMRKSMLLKLGQIKADMTDLVDRDNTIEMDAMLSNCEAVLDKHIAELSEPK